RSGECGWREQTVRGGCREGQANGAVRPNAAAPARAGHLPERGHPPGGFARTAGLARCPILGRGHQAEGIAQVLRGFGVRSLRVYVDREPVGTLHEGNDLWRFEYSEAWSSVPEGAPNAYDLSPALPRIRREHVDGSTLRPVQWFFDNLLPEEMLRAAVSREAGIKGEDAFALLEYLGAESAGSLTWWPPGREHAGGQSLRPLGDADLSRRIALLPRQTLASHAPKRMSLAGAQHKLLVVLQEGRLYEPVGAAPSTHILKPEHPDTETYPASVINEYRTMRLARAVRLPVPNVHIRYVPDPVYI